MLLRARLDDPVDQTILERLLGAQVVVALGVDADLLVGLAGCFGKHGVELFLELDDLLSCLVSWIFKTPKNILRFVGNHFKRVYRAYFLSLKN